MKIFIGTNNSCGLNYQYDYIYYELKKYYELTTEVSEADLIIFISTCSCTEYNIRCTINYIADILSQKKPTTKTYLTGCLTRKFDNNPFLKKVEAWLEKYIDYIIPQNQPNALLNQINANIFKEDSINGFGFYTTKIQNWAELYIANGCQNNCSFCKTTFQKYPLKSAELAEVKEAIDDLEERAISNLIIKATNISQYGLDLYHDYKLPEIIEYIEQKGNIKNIYLMGFTFKDAIHHDFKDTLKESTKLRGIDGSLESGSPRLLKMMNKGFTTEELLDFVEWIRKKYPKKLFLNVIAGFPTETLEDVYLTLETLKLLQPARVDLCRYVNSSFVESSKYPQLPPETIKEHARIYAKVLKKRKVNVEIYGSSYKYNQIYKRV